MSNASTSNVASAFDRLLSAPVRAQILRFAPFLLFLGMLVLCAYLAARLSWQFASPAVAATPTSTMGGASANAGVIETPSEKIAAAHLFGSAHAPSASVTARNAPETSLDLTLAGVAAANPDGLSYAIITNGNRGGKDTYGIGARLPGGALVRKILPDRVVIAHDGRLETLRLPWADLSKFDTTSGSAASKLTAPKQLRQRILAHPQSLAEYVQIRPYNKDGHFAGFRIYPQKRPELFRKLGFQPGDVITSVNGIPLNNNPANLAKAMKAFKTSERAVTLGILRDGQHITLTPHLGG